MFAAAAGVFVLSRSLMLLCGIRCVNTPLFIQLIPLLCSVLIGLGAYDTHDCFKCKCICFSFRKTRISLPGL